MRVLTKLEQFAFHDAFNCIMRISNSTTRDIYDIRVEDTIVSKEMLDLAKDIGGMDKLEHHFCPMHRKESMELLVDRCFRKRIQPSAFIFEGTIKIIDKDKPMYQHTYTEYKEDN